LYPDGRLINNISNSAGFVKPEKNCILDEIMFIREVLINKPMVSYSWPGNVRQLENLIERLLVTSDGCEITVEDLPGEFRADLTEESPRVILTGVLPLKVAVAQLEVQLIKMAISRVKTAEAASELLGVHPTTLMRKLKKKRNQ